MEILQQEIKNNKDYFVNKDENNYVLIDSSLIHGKKTDWKNSVGTHIIGKYKGIEFDFNVLRHTYEDNKLKLFIEHEGNEKVLYPSGMKRFCGFDVLLGFRTFEFKYEIGQHIKDENRDFVIIDRIKEKDSRGHSWKSYKIHCNKCGFDSGENYLSGDYRKDYWIKEAIITKGHGCGCCSRQFCVTGINDMWTTDPEIAMLLSDKNDGYKYITNTSTPLKFLCSSCGSDTIAIPSNVKKYGKVTCSCSDNYSYPEKFIYSMLKQLKIEFIWQYSKKNCNWIKDNRKYDFYFKIGEDEFIIEANGRQHYTDSFGRISERARTLKEEQDNDKFKRDLALVNGIKKQNYIVIDFRESNLNWGKEHICNSRLKEIFDLSVVDWGECNNYSISSLVVEVCKIKEANKDFGVKKISEITGLNEGLVRSYLHSGKTLKNVDYEYIPRAKGEGSFIKLVAEDGTHLGNFKSAHELDRLSKSLFGRRLNFSNVNTCMRKNKPLFGITISEITKEEYYSSETNHVKYIIKDKVYKTTDIKSQKEKYFNSYRQLYFYLKNEHGVSLGEKRFKRYLDSESECDGFIIESKLLSLQEQEKLIKEGMMINGK